MQKKNWKSNVSRVILALNDAKIYIGNNDSKYLKIIVFIVDI